MYQSPQADIRQILIDKNIAPANQIVTGGRTEKYPGDYQIVVRMISSNSNPKWYYDDLTFSFMVIGQRREDQGVVEDKCYEIYNTLLGGPTQSVNNINYLQFNGQSMPNFVGYSDDNSKPMYVCVLEINRQVQVVETGANRKPLV